MYGYKVVLQVIGLLFAFATRNVKVKGLDDSKYIAAAIYVTSIVLATTVISTIFLANLINAFAALFSTGIFIGTTVILGLVFVQKVRTLETSGNSEVAKPWGGGMYIILQMYKNSLLSLSISSTKALR